MTDFTPPEKATPIREPSTANLLIDSADNNNLSGNVGANVLQCYDFQIQKKCNILNGFFTRIGVSEVVLEWFVPNIHGAYTNGGYDGNANNTLTFEATGVASITLTITEGNYTVNDLANAVDFALTNACAGLSPAVVWTNGIAQKYTGGVVIQSPALVPSQIITGVKFTGPIADLLGLSPVSTTYRPTGPVFLSHDIDLRPYRYLDFTSPSLTYTQSLKDSSTSSVVRDVLCRWYFTWDTPVRIDGLGYPILMGYEPFTARRLFSPPKQIKWESNLPIGNLAFQVFGDDGQLATLMVKNTFGNPAHLMAGCNWLMTLQVSEV